MQKCLKLYLFCKCKSLCSTVFAIQLFSTWMSGHKSLQKWHLPFSENKTTNGSAAVDETLGEVCDTVDPVCFETSLSLLLLASFGNCFKLIFWVLDFAPENVTEIY